VFLICRQCRRVIVRAYCVKRSQRLFDTADIMGPKDESEDCKDVVDIQWQLCGGLVDERCQDLESDLNIAIRALLSGVRHSSSLLPTYPMRPLAISLSVFFSRNGATFCSLLGLELA
jgi:hypothetical protein